MDDFVDQIMLLALCGLLLLGTPTEPFAVAAALAAVALGCLRPACAPLWLRYAAMGAFLAATMAWSFWAIFLPLVAYAGLRERSWPLRLAWIAALAAALARQQLPPSAELGIAVLCAVAAILAIRQTRNAAERQAMQAARDGLRERLMELTTSSTPAAMPLGEAAPSEGKAVYAGIFGDLTERERAIVGLVAEGLDNKDIAAELYLSEGTVRNHVSAVLQKLELKNRTQLAVLYLTEGA